jgi:hypothetical protein
MDLLHREAEDPVPEEPAQLIRLVADLWIEHADELSVPNDGSAESRILAICRQQLAGEPATDPDGVASLVDRLEQGSGG